jgi:glycosyltransferase involved in cell wall biosynthesis
LHAVGQVPYSARLVYHDRQLMREHGSELSGCQLPGNLRVMEDDGSPESWMASIRRAKLVVIPVHPDSLRAVGVGMCLVAMALRKCVIITEGHATRGIINDEALVVPPSDPAALAQAIRRGWEDDVLRQRVADNGRRYAEQVRDATRLYSDLLEACAEISQSSLSREASAR